MTTPARRVNTPHAHMTYTDAPDGTRVWRLATDAEVAAERTAEQRRYLGERPDPADLTDEELTAELAAGDDTQRATMAEVRARNMTGRAGVTELVEAGRHDRAWSRRAQDLEAEQTRRERGALDFATSDSTRRAVLALRAAHRELRVVLVTPDDDVAAWAALTTQEIYAWLSVLRTVQALR